MRRTILPTCALRLPIACAVLFLVGCVAGQENRPAGSALKDEAGSLEAPPRLATYRCGKAGDMTIEINGMSAHVIDPNGLETDLAASPPGQLNRFSDALNALVIEGREAFWMANRKEPITCRR